MEVSTDTTVNELVGTSVTALNESKTPESQGQSTTSAGSDFAAFMRTALGKSEGQKVSEEELYAAIIEKRLELHDPEAAAHFREQKSALMRSMARADGYVSVEAVAVEALKSTVAAGKIEREDAELINGQAFVAAQLNDVKDELWDDRGSENDPTIAVAEMEAALLLARSTLDDIESGELEVTARSLDKGATGGASVNASSAAHGSSGSAPTGSQSIDGSGGFLWKPVSEGDGKLVVLLPTSFKGMIDRVEIHREIPPSDDTLIDRGRFAGDTHNGGRPHFRFPKAGAEYGSNVYVVVYQNNGESAHWTIGNGADRHD